MKSGFRSKKQVVYDLLREGIIQGEYAPGTRLVIDELASKINVSQIPIREAIQQLEADGFVTVEPYVGARVAELDTNFIFEVFALLESLEVICSRAACTHITEEQLEKLEQMILEMDECAKDNQKWSARNREMHVFICECADTQLVLKMLHKAFDHWERLRSVYLKDVTDNRIAESQREHKLLLEALKKRDADEVEKIVHAHNQSALKSYITRLESKGHSVSIES